MGITKIVDSRLTVDDYVICFYCLRIRALSVVHCFSRSLWIWLLHLLYLFLIVSPAPLFSCISDVLFGGSVFLAFCVLVFFGSVSAYN